MDSITRNKLAHKTTLPLIIDQILVSLDESIGNKVMVSLWDYMFQPVPHMNKGTRGLIDTKVVTCHKSAHTENCETLGNFFL